MIKYRNDTNNFDKIIFSVEQYLEYNISEVKNRRDNNVN